MSRLRSSIRWLLTPLLIVIDKRIAWRARPLDERMSRAERELAGLQEYVRLVAGSLAPAPDTAPGETAPGETAPPPTPAPANGAVPVPAPQTGGHVEFTDRLACPVCRSRVQVVPEIVTADGRTKRGHVPCGRCEQVVALVRDFRVDFRARRGPIPEPAGPPRIVPAIGEIRLPFDDPRLCLNGGWTVWDGRFAVSHGSLADSLEYRGRFTDALVHLVTHVNGGVVDFFVDGRLTATADLYSDHWFVLPFTIASDLPFEEHGLRIQPRGTRNPAATSADVFVAELVLTGPQTDPGFEAPRPLNRGNAYIEVFERHIAQVPEGELILEVGGGERRRLRRGYINLEYMTVECADVYGDIERLPFQDDTFSLVLTQAVFEHLANPHVAAAELIRVTRPGGTIVTDVAFMQPLHAAPYHYYNMTPWGAEELFKSCTIVESDHYDGLASTIEWILRSVQAHTKVSEREFADLVERVRAIEAKLSHSEIRAAASGVWVVARKPVAGSGPGQPVRAVAAAEDSIAAR